MRPAKIMLLLLSEFLFFAQTSGQNIDSLKQALINVKEDTDKVNNYLVLIKSIEAGDPQKALVYGDKALSLSKKLNWIKGIAEVSIRMGYSRRLLNDSPGSIGLYLKGLELARKYRLKSTESKAVYNLGSTFYYFKNYAQAIRYFRECVALDRQIGDKKLEADDISFIGTVCREAGNDSLAIEYQKQSLPLYRAVNDYNAELNVLAIISGIYRSRNDYMNALKYCQKGYDLSRSSRDSLEMALGLQRIGDIYRLMAAYPEALDYYLKSTAAFATIHDSKHELNSQLNISYVYYLMRDYAGCLDYCGKVIVGATRTGDSMNLALALDNTGAVYHMLRDYDKSLSYYTNSYQIAKQQGYTSPAVVALGNIGGSYIELHAWKKADSTLKEGLRQARAAGLREQEAAMLGNLGNLYTKLKRYDEAIAWCKQSISLAGNIGNVTDRMNGLNYLQAAYEGAGMPAPALKAYQQYITLRDSITGSEQAKKMVRNEIQFGYDKRKFADSLQNAQALNLSTLKLRQQRLIVVLSIGISLAVIILIVVLQRAKIRRTRTEQKNLFARQLLEIELKALRAQMNPHFIFNCLNSIQAFILRENRVEASDYLQKFSRLIRLILDNSQKTSHTLEDETEILHLYLDLEKLRLKNRFDFEIHIADALDSSFTEIPSMVLQPLVENSIWHGLMHSEEKGKLKVAFMKGENRLTCIVEDNGIGRERSIEMKNELGRKHESKGMKLIEDRLKAWSETKGLNYIFNIFDNVENGRGTRTEITILYPVYA